MSLNRTRIMVDGRKLEVYYHTNPIEISSVWESGTSNKAECNEQLIKAKIHKEENDE